MTIKVFKINRLARARTALPPRRPSGFFQKDPRHTIAPGEHGWAGDGSHHLERALMFRRARKAAELAAERLAGPIPARVLAVIDGDTIEVQARIWLGQEINTRGLKR